MRRQRTGVIAGGILALWLLGDARAADHGDGSIDMDVTQSLLEGPVYPTAAAELDIAYRQPPAAALPGGQMRLLLNDAQGGSPLNGPLPLMATVVDNGDAFAEPGDQASADMRFVAGAAPANVYPDTSSFEWIVRFEPAGGVSEWALREWKPSNSGNEFQFYEVDVVLNDPGASPIAAVRFTVAFHLAPGQDLAFSNPSITAPPSASSATEIHIGFDLDQTGGSVDTAEPLYSMIITTIAIPIPAVRPPWGPAVMGLLLLLGIFLALRGGRERHS